MNKELYQNWVALLESLTYEKKLEKRDELLRTIEMMSDKDTIRDAQEMVRIMENYIKTDECLMLHDLTKS